MREDVKKWLAKWPSLLSFLKKANIPSRMQLDEFFDMRLTDLPWICETRDMFAMGITNLSMCERMYELLEDMPDARLPYDDSHL